MAQPVGRRRDEWTNPWKDVKGACVYPGSCRDTTFTDIPGFGQSGRKLGLCLEFFFVTFFCFQDKRK